MSATPTFPPQCGGIYPLHKGAIPLWRAFSSLKFFPTTRQTRGFPLQTERPPRWGLGALARGTLNPRFRRGCFLRCGSFFFRLKTMIFFPAGKIWWIKNLKAFRVPKQKDHPDGVVFLFWCEEWDLNPHVVRHTHLKRACLPIPASSQINVAIIAPENTDVNGFLRNFPQKTATQNFHSPLDKISSIHHNIKERK